MSNKVQDISIGTRIYYFFNDISNIKRLTNKLASKGLQKKFLIHWIGYMTYLYFKANFFKSFFLKCKYSVVFLHHN